MVADPSRPAGPSLRVLPMKTEHVFRLSPRAEARLQEFCRQADCEDQDQAVQDLIAHGLNTLQRGLPMYRDVLVEPHPADDPDHNRGPE